MRHIKPGTYEKITAAALALSELENGTRNQTKSENKNIIDLVYRHCKACAKLPKRYEFLYIETSNLGTSKYPDTFNEVRHGSFCTGQFAYTTMRETEKSYIFETDSGSKRVIPKDKMLVFIW